jgi:hypothetical protein
MSKRSWPVCDWKKTSGINVVDPNLAVDAHGLRIRGDGGIATELHLEGSEIQRIGIVKRVGAKEMELLEGVALPGSVQLQSLIVDIVVEQRPALRIGDERVIAGVVGQIEKRAPIREIGPVEKRPYMIELGLGGLDDKPRETHQSDNYAVPSKLHGRLPP